MADPETFSIFGFGFLLPMIAPPLLLDVYWSMPPKRAQDFDENKPHPADTLLDAVEHPKVFGSILANWLARDSERREARCRFSSGFSELNSFGIDRLVGAANMFDILPTSATSPSPPLSGDVLEAKQKRRESRTAKTLTFYRS